MKKLIENTTNSPIYVSGTMVPPHEQMLVEVPGAEEAPQADTPPTLAEETAVLLKKAVPAITAELPTLSGDVLEMMLALEGNAERPRSTLLTAINQEQIARANEQLEKDGKAERARLLAEAQTRLETAKNLLDVEVDTDKHPALQAAVDAAKAEVAVLSVDAT